MIDLRLGRWQDVLDDIDTPASGLLHVVTDTPYSERTHTGALSQTGARGVTGYAAWGETEVREFACRWSGATGWVLVCTDDVIGPVFQESLAAVGRYTFPLVPVLQHQPRQLLDGPPQHGFYLAVSRPRAASFTAYQGGWGHVPGWHGPHPRDGSVVRGGKPLRLMRELVSLYTNPGDLVVDPCAGGGTTLIAAAELGCRAIGAEMDPDTYAKAKARIAKGYTPLPHPRAGRAGARPTQRALW